MMNAAVRQRAHDSGFDDCHFTTAAAPDHAAQFQDWLGENRHGEMNYLQRNAHKRVDPQQVLPGAKSVIVLAASYHIEKSGTANVEQAEGVVPVIARYARFKDYHDVLAERLKALTEFVNSMSSQSCSRSPRTVHRFPSRPSTPSPVDRPTLFAFAEEIKSSSPPGKNGAWFLLMTN